MLRSLAAVTLALLLAPFVVSQETGKQDPKKQDDKKAAPGKLTITWHGQSFFSVTSSKGTVFCFDPHAIPEYGRLEGVKPNLVMTSHNHNDHTQVAIFENAKEKGDKGITVVSGLKQGEDGKETWNTIDKMEFKDLKIKCIGAYHDDVNGMKHGKVGMFVVEVDGVRICHLGDLGHRLSPKQLKALGDIDILMVPCGGIYGLNGSEARTVVADIKPKQFILPMHIGNRRYEDLLPVDEFIDDSPYPCAIVRDGILVYSKNARNNVQWLRENTNESDNTLVYEADAKRKGPVVVNLHYWPQPKKFKK